MMKLKVAQAGVVVSGGVQVRTRACGQARRSSSQQTQKTSLVALTSSSDQSLISTEHPVLDHSNVGRRQLLSGIASVLIWQASPVNPFSWATASASGVPGPQTPSPEVAKALNAVLDKVITKPKVWISKSELIPVSR